MALFREIGWKTGKKNHNFRSQMEKRRNEHTRVFSGGEPGNQLAFLSGLKPGFKVDWWKPGR